MAKKKKGGNPIGPHVGKFLKYWLPNVRQKSQHTVRSYAGMFKALNRFFMEERGVRPVDINFEMLDADTIAEFVAWMSKSMSASSVQTRIGALRSFANYVVSVMPAEFAFYYAMKQVKAPKHPEELVRYMEVDAIEAIFDEAAKSDLRDYAIVRTLYSGGLRSDELRKITPRDVRFSNDGRALLDVVGKGRRARSVKVDACTAKVLAMHMSQNSPDPEKPVFLNRNGKALSTAGLEYIVEKYSRRARASGCRLIPEHVTPHMFRHSIATHMLRSGSDLESIRLFLGHASLKTTARYAKSDPAALSEYVAMLEEGILKQSIPSVAENKKKDMDAWILEEYGVVV